MTNERKALNEELERIERRDEYVKVTDLNLMRDKAKKILDLSEKLKVRSAADRINNHDLQAIVMELIGDLTP